MHVSLGLDTKADLIREHFRYPCIPQDCANASAQYEQIIQLVVSSPENGKSFVSMEMCTGVNMDLCGGAATPSKHPALMPAVEFNKLER